MIWTYGNPQLTSADLIGGAVMILVSIHFAIAMNCLAPPQKIEAHGQLRDGVDLNEEINLYYANLIARLTIGIDGS